MFWNCTPWQFSRIVKSHIKKTKDDHNSQAWHTWHNAVLSKFQGKNFPKLETLLTHENNSVKTIDANAIMERLKLYNKSLREDNA